MTIKERIEATGHATQTAAAALISLGALSASELAVLGAALASGWYPNKDHLYYETMGRLSLLELPADLLEVLVPLAFEKKVGRDREGKERS